MYEVKRKNFDLDYENDIVPLILKYKIDDIFYRLKMCPYSVFEGLGMLNGAWILETIYPYCRKNVLNYIPSKNYISLTKLNENDLEELDYKVLWAAHDYNSYRKLLHYFLKKTSSQIAKKYIELELKRKDDSWLDRRVKILEFLVFVCDDIEFTDAVPEELYPQMYHLIKHAINLIFSEFDEIYLTPNLDFIEEEIPLKKIPKNIYMYDYGLVIDGYKFHSTNDIKGCFSYELKKEDIQFVCFKNCEFEKLNTIYLDTNAYFQNCIFTDELKILGRRDYSMEFSGCKFYKEVSVPSLQIHSCDLSILNSIFEENAPFIISRIFSRTYNEPPKEHLYGDGPSLMSYEKSDMLDKLHPGRNGTLGLGKYSSLNSDKFQAIIHDSSNLILENVIFNSSVNLEEICDMDVILKNVSFFKPFRIRKARLRKNSSISNICIPMNKSLEFEESKKELYNALVASNLEEIVENLNLTPKKRKSTVDDLEYQEAIQKGWLNPKQAARFLGKSVRTLQEKRKNDQIQITKESLPFKGEGRDIVYPLDALKAYLAQDWNLLKELRKKYWKKD